MSGDILDTIDATLEDYAVSNDAMRWQPPEKREPEPGPIEWPGGGEVVQLGPGVDTYAVGPNGGCTYIGHTDGPVAFQFQVDTEPFERAIADIGHQLTAFAEMTATAFAPLTRDILRVFGVKPWEIGIGPSPKRLSAMHTEYHRRSAARRKRKR